MLAIIITPNEQDDPSRLAGPFNTYEEAIHFADKHKHSWDQWRVMQLAELILD